MAHFFAFFEICKIHTPLHRSKFDFRKILQDFNDFSGFLQDFAESRLKLHIFGRNFHGILPELQEIVDNDKKSIEFMEIQKKY